MKAFYYTTTNVRVCVCDFIVNGKRQQELMDAIGRTRRPVTATGTSAP